MFYSVPKADRLQVLPGLDQVHPDVGCARCGRDDLHHCSSHQQQGKYMYTPPFNGLTMSVLSFIRAPPDTKAGQAEREKEEKRWIDRLSRVVPRGLNL